MNHLISFAQGAFSDCAGTFVGAALCLGALKIMTPRSPLSAFFRLIRPGNASAAQEGEAARLRFDLLFDAILIACAGVALNVLGSQICEQIALAVSPTVPIDSLYVLPSMADAGSPFLYGLLSLLRSAMSSSALVVLILGMVAKYLPGPRRFFMVAYLLLAIVNSGERYWQDYVLALLKGSVSIASSYFVVVKLARANYLAYAIFFFHSYLIAYVAPIVINDCKLFQTDLVLFVVLASTPFVVLALFWSRRRRRFP
jgi:hypothetical protein